MELQQYRESERDSEIMLIDKYITAEALIWAVQ